MAEQRTVTYYWISPKNDALSCLYIGSTIMSLKSRISAHKSQAKISPNRLLYKYILENGGWDQFIFHLGKEEPFVSEELQHREEQKYIDSTNPPLNSIKAYVPPCQHGRQKNECLECVGTGICQHDRRRRHCWECEGSQICEHGSRRSVCKICSPVLCRICDKTFSKNSIKRHLKSKIHLQKSDLCQKEMDSAANLSVKPILVDDTELIIKNIPVPVTPENLNFSK